jgi:anti-sigma regulatory factor (Ser/Thr protein kinase)
MKKKRPSKKQNIKRQSLTFPCHPKYLITIRKVVARMWRLNKLPLRDRRLVILAVDEAVSAIVQHASAVKQTGQININIDINDVRLMVIIQDNIRYFDLDSLSELERHAILLKEKRHQISLYLINTIMDEVNYVYKKGFENELRLVKFIKPSGLAGDNSKK